MEVGILGVSADFLNLRLSVHLELHKLLSLRYNPSPEILAGLTTLAAVLSLPEVLHELHELFKYHHDPKMNHKNSARINRMVCMRIIS